MHDTYLFEAFLADLYSDDKFMRELSISQLHSFVAVPKVRFEIEKAMQRETDPYLKYKLEGLLNLCALEARQSEKVLPQQLEELDEEEIVQKWFSRDISNIKELFLHLAHLERAQGCEVFARIIQQEKELFRLIPAFSISNNLVKDPLIIKALANQLMAGDDIFVIRLIAFLKVHGPGFLLKHIQKLLKHTNYFIRVNAMLVLFKYAKPQALRLLEELVFSKEQLKRSAGGFLFLFPFEAVHCIVLSLIDSGGLKDEYLGKLIENLIYNNPDLEFFKKLTIIEVLRREEIPELTNLRMKSAQSLKLAGILKGDSELFCETSLTKAIEFIRKKSGVTVEPEERLESKIEVNTTSSAPKKTNISADERKILEILKLKALGNDEKVCIREMVLSGKADGFITPFLKVVLKFRPKDSRVIQWLEENIGKTNPKELLIIMKVLADLNPARLHPHLSVLCLNENNLISSQAIRLYRKLFHRELLKQIETWLREDNELTWKAALSAMLQLRIEDARNILLIAFQSTNRISLIKYFSPIFQISPDHMSLYQLGRLYENSSGKKKDILFEQIKMLKEALGLTSDKNDESESAKLLAESGFQGKFEEFRERLDNIRYISDPDQIVQDINKLLEKHWLKIFAFALFVLAIVFWPQEKLISDKRLAGKSLQKNFKIKAETPKVKIGSIKVFTLTSYDPINRHWRAKSLTGHTFKLKLQSPGDFKIGFKGNFAIKQYAVSSLGNPVVTCELTQ